MNVGLNDASNRMSTDVDDLAITTADADPQSANDGVVANIVFATKQALANTGTESVALTDSKPLAAMLAETGETNAEMFEWHITKLPDSQIVRASEVRQVVMALISDVLTSRTKNPDWSDAQHRDRLMTDNGAYSKLSFTHPRLVLMVCATDFNPRKLHYVLEMIEMREQHETSTLSFEQKQAQVSQYFQSRFVRPAEPGEEERAVQDGTGLRATMVKGPPVVAPTTSSTH